MGGRGASCLVGAPQGPGQPTMQDPDNPHNAADAARRIAGRSWAPLPSTCPFSCHHQSPPDPTLQRGAHLDHQVDAPPLMLPALITSSIGNQENQESTFSFHQLCQPPVITPPTHTHTCGMPALTTSGVASSGQASSALSPSTHTCTCHDKQHATFVRVRDEHACACGDEHARVCMYMCVHACVCICKACNPVRACMCAKRL